MASDVKLPALDPATLPGESRQPYPAPYDNALAGRVRRTLADPLGITQFGVNITRLEPGSVSSIRHWHTGEDEFILVLEGEVTLVTNDAEQILRPHCVAGFPAGKPDAHRLENRSGAPAAYLEVGTRCDTEEVHYPDADLLLVKEDGGGKRTFFHKDGEPY